MGKEKKLRLLLPNKGWLVHPKRWTIKNILELAGIGGYTRGSNELNFKSYDPEIEVETRRAKDIPPDTNFFDMSITGRDLTVDADCPTGEEVLDLECSYVDLAFMTHLETWKRVVKKWKEMNSILPREAKNFDNLELFLACRMFFLRDKNPNLFCDTTYLKIAQKKLNETKKIVSEVFPKREAPNIHTLKVTGTLEKRLKEINEDGGADMIFETIATGQSVKQYNLFVLQNVMSSTAILYQNLLVGSGCFEEIGIPNVTDPLTYWKYRKSEELKNKIEDILKDVREHCQVKIDFYPFYNTDTPIGKIIYDFLDKHAGCICNNPSLDRERSLESKVSTTTFIMHKKYLPKIKNFPKRSNSQCFISGMEVFDLKSLYAYCPLLPFSLSGEYPCADSSSLRSEHRKKAVIFSYSKEGKQSEN